MSSVELKNVTVEIGGVKILKDISMSIESGDFVALLGPTNAGKTTLLYTIAGLIRPSKGRIYIDGKDVTDLPPQKRDVAMVFQIFALYPNMSVFENIASPLLAKGMNKEDVIEKVNNIAKLLGLEKLLEKRPQELSGGEAQRVVIARALAKGSKLVLMDEPLTNLDYKLREVLTSDLKKLFGSGERKQTVIYATANPIEASALAKKIIFIYDGRIVQTGLTKECFNNPINTTAARYYSVPPMNFIDGIIKIDGNRKFLEAPGLFTYEITDQRTELGFERCIVGIYPYSLKLFPEGEQCIRITGNLILQEIQGSDMVLTIQCGNNLLNVYVPYVKQINPGAPVELYVKPENVYLFEKESGKFVGRLGKGVV